MRWWLWGFLCACSLTDIERHQGGKPLDSAVTDSNVTDSSAMDASVTDAAVTDAAVTDAAVTDAAVTDAAVTDAAVTDAAVTDSAVMDAATDAATDAAVPPFVCPASAFYCADFDTQAIGRMICPGGALTEVPTNSGVGARFAAASDDECYRAAPVQISTAEYWMRADVRLIGAPGASLWSPFLTTRSVGETQHWLALHPSLNIHVGYSPTAAVDNGTPTDIPIPTDASWHCFEIRVRVAETGLVEVYQDGSLRDYFNKDTRLSGAIDEFTFGPQSSPRDYVMEMDNVVLSPSRVPCMR